MTDIAFASLICSRLCHDLVGPVGALSNGIELMELEDDPTMAQDALELLKQSADSATRRLKFLRLAFGASGGDAMPLAVNDARSAALAFFADHRLELDWPAHTGPEPQKNRVRLALNLIMSAAFGLIRGGRLSVEIGGDRLVITGSHPSAGIPDQVMQALAGTAQARDVEDARIIEAFNASLLAEAEGLQIRVANTPGFFEIAAV